MSSVGGRAFQCQNCGSTSLSQNKLHDFPSIHACAACGLTVQEGSFKLQDELATMFAQNMNFSGGRDHQQLQEDRQIPPPTYSISQHYHHSAHIALPDPPSTASHDQTSTTETSTSKEAKRLLLQHEVNPSYLLPSQLTLFEQALPEQKSRLVELWRISPPEYTSYGAQELADELGAWQQTTLEQEEEMARLRFARRTAREEARTNTDQMSLENRSLNNEGCNRRGDHGMVEPYIDSGYELLAQREYDQQQQPENGAKETYQPLGSSVGTYNRALDPVFRGKGWWNVDEGQQPMEHQYGMFDQINQFGTPIHTTINLDRHEDEEML